MITEKYAKLLSSSIEKICLTQKEQIQAAAQLVAQTIKKDGLIYVFGCGHSHMLAEETFYRAGGLACVAPIFAEPLMLHKSASQSSTLEKCSGLAQDILSSYPIEKRDIFICISTSGINAVPVEVADLVCQLHIPVIAITSSSYDLQNPRNALNKHLNECCNIWIDNLAPLGDACLNLPGLDISITPVSSITSMYIINSILAEATQIALNDGVNVPVYLSGNVPGGTEYNQAMLQRFSSRIRHL